MKELKDYTDEELREEIHRRANVKRQIARERERMRNHWKYWLGTVKKIEKEDIRISTYQFKYVVEPIDEVICEEFDYTGKRLYTKHAVFNQKTAPRVGDTVRCRYYIHKSKPDCIHHSKIIEVIKRKGE